MQTMVRTGSDEQHVSVGAALGTSLLSLLLTGVFLLIGPGLVMDDWWSLRNVHFEGAFAASGSEQWLARPGAGVIYAFIFGVVGDHPALLIGMLGVLNAATAFVLARLLGRFFPAPLAVGSVVIWLLLPNHLSVEAWASATNIAVSQLATVLVLLVLSHGDHRPGTLVALVALTLLAALSYEACIPVLVAGAVGIPWARRAVDWRLVAAVVGAAAAAAAWILVHYHPAKGVARTVADVTQVLPANMGWGIFADGPLQSLGLLTGMAFAVVGLARVFLPSLRRHRGPPELLVVTGLVVLVVGTLPFLLYSYEPFGGGDRVNYLSAMGGAMVWMGGFAMIGRKDLRVTLGLVVVLAACVLPVRWERWELWHRAGQDAAALGAAVRAAIPQPAGEITLGPQPIVVQNVGAFVEPYAAEAAVQLAYDDNRVRVRLSKDHATFDAAPPDRRFDLRSISTLSPP